MLSYDDFTIEMATLLQNKMKEDISLNTRNKNIRTVAGADISHDVGSSKLFAGIVILSYPDMIPLSYSLAEGNSNFEYKAEYLAFREVPTLMKAWEQIPIKPDLLILDGQGITHPRRMGIASHFGLLADHPTIGCAKNMLHGEYNVLEDEKFSYSAIFKNQEKLGFALRTKTNVKPVFISPGHHMSVDDSLEIMTNTIQKYRIPEPTRHAHLMVNLFRTGQRQAGFHEFNNQLPLF
ncbi:deoxyribonuclease V [Flavobacterium gossypii]|uniref:Endonuclease V n=2 Tax=Flavobacterium gossypii TaxID=1646119 RepID=A0ABR6DW47_9FLAO|nr:deoxyribonuclease V [Flavobacterium gossypii]